MHPGEGLFLKCHLAQWHPNKGLGLRRTQASKLVLRIDPNLADNRLMGVARSVVPQPPKPPLSSSYSVSCPTSLRPFVPDSRVTFLA